MSTRGRRDERDAGHRGALGGRQGAETEPAVSLPPPARKSAVAARQALRRRRARKGLVVLAVEVDEIALTASLVALGRLDAANIDDRHCIAEALSKWIDDIAKKVTRDCTLLFPR